MCEINPKHSAFFRLEAFTSNPEMTKEEFTAEVIQRVFDIEQQLNADGRFRFHIHEEKTRRSRPIRRCSCTSSTDPNCPVHGRQS